MSEDNNEESPTVLVVDDDSDQLLLFQALLERDGYQVLTAITPEDALAYLEKGGVDCVVSDVMMPGIDGKSLVQIIRLSTTFSAVPVIMVTAAAKDSEQSLMAEGADAFCMKETASKKLSALIEKLLADAGGSEL